LTVTTTVLKCAIIWSVEGDRERTTTIGSPAYLCLIMTVSKPVTNAHSHSQLKAKQYIQIYYFVSS